MPEGLIDALPDQSVADLLAYYHAEDRGLHEEAGRLLDRALVWTPDGRLDNLAPRPALCFNPVLGAAPRDTCVARGSIASGIPEAPSTSDTVPSASLSFPMASMTNGS